MSNRGLHVCFETRAQAEAAYADAVLLGRSSILEGTQVVEPGILPKKKDNQQGKQA